MEPINKKSIAEDPYAFTNYFDDLARKQDADLLANKIKVVRNDLSPAIFQSSSFSSQQLEKSPEQKVENATTAILNQQFFVWKNGQAGNMSVDTPFGFKGI